MGTDLLTQDDTLQYRLKGLFDEMQELIGDSITASPMAALISELATLRVDNPESLQATERPKLLLTEDLIQRVVTIVLQGTSMRAAAATCGVGARVHNHWMHQGKKLLTSLQEDVDGKPLTATQRLKVIYREALMQAVLMSEGALVRTVKRHAETDWRAASFLLARRFPKRWGAGRERGTVDVQARLDVTTNGVLAVAPAATTVAGWAGLADQPTQSIDLNEVPELRDLDLPRTITE